MRAMLTDAGLPGALWAEAVSTANYVRVRSPATHKTKTPHELFYGYKPDVSNLRVFGSTAYVFVPKIKRTKLESRSVRGVMVGYSDTVKGYRILLDNHYIEISRDVIFNEHVGAAVQDLPTQAPAAPALDIADGEVELEAESEPAPAEAPADAEPPPQGEPAEAPPGPARYPTRNRRAPDQFWRGTQGRAHHACREPAAEPATYEEAMTCDHAAQWKEAMDEEMASLEANQTWVLEDLPVHASAIPVMWIYKLKTDAAGQVERYKARLVAKGFKQRDGIDFNEVFAPVSKYATLRALLAVAAEQDLEVRQLDIKTAFLNGELDEDLYVLQPPGYVTGPQSTVCHLRKALYGLRQAPRQWHICLKQALERCGFAAADADPGLFVRDKGYRVRVGLGIGYRIPYPNLAQSSYSYM